MRPTMIPSLSIRNILGVAVTEYSFLKSLLSEKSQRWRAELTVLK